MPQFLSGRVSSRTLRATTLLGLLLLAGCKTELYASLPEQDANEMMAILQTQGISAEKLRAKDGTETVSVDKAQFSEAMTLLQSHGLPHKKFDNIGEIFKASGLVASPMQDRARFLYALSQELSFHRIGNRWGVDRAGRGGAADNDIMQRNPTPSSASVFVRYDSKSHVDQLVPQIKMLVANSVEGLSYDKVSVVLVPVVRIDAAAPVRGRGPGWIDRVDGRAVLLLVAAGGGLIYRQKLAEMMGRRGGFPTHLTG